MKKKTPAKTYLKWAAIFGAIGWATFFLAGILAIFGYYTYAIYVGGFSIFVGWFVSGYFWVRLGLSQGKNIKEIVLKRRK